MMITDPRGCKARRSALRSLQFGFVTAVHCSSILLQPNHAVAAALYAIDDAASSVRILVYRAGLLGKLGHNHVVSLRAMQGCVLRREPIHESQLLIRFAVQNLLVDEDAERRAAGDDFPGSVADKDIRGTRLNMLGTKLLDADQNPEILVYANGLTGQLPALQLNGRIRILQKDFALELPLQVTDAEGHLVASGERQLTHSELGLQPFRAAFGALRVADEIQLRYRIRARLLVDENEISDCQRALAVIDDDLVTIPHDTAE